MRRRARRGGREEDLRQVRTWVSEVDLAIVAGGELLASDPHIRQCAEALSELGIGAGMKLGRRNSSERLALFRNIPEISHSNQRTVDEFPHDMLLNASRSKVCVLSGVSARQSGGLLCKASGQKGRHPSEDVRHSGSVQRGESGRLVQADTRDAQTGLDWGIRGQAPDPRNLSLRADPREMGTHFTSPHSALSQGWVEKKKRCSRHRI